MNQKIKALAGGGFFVALGAAWIAMELDRETVVPDARMVVSMSQGTTPEEATVASAAIEVLLERCQALREPRFTDLQASVSNASGTFMADYWGWQRFVRVEIKDESNGHTLHYTMGGGGQPGIYVYKGGSLDVCEFPKAPEGLDGSFAAEERLVSAGLG